jgi:hypothetical protein
MVPAGLITLLVTADTSKHVYSRDVQKRFPGRPHAVLRSIL